MAVLDFKTLRRPAVFKPKTRNLLKKKIASGGGGSIIIRVVIDDFISHSVLNLYILQLA